MQNTKFIWVDGHLVPWQEAHVHVLTYTLHYGAGVFEGIKLYATQQGPAIFRLDEHIDRLFDSFAVFEKTIPFTQVQIKDAIIELVQANELKAGYIRPIIFLGYGVMGLDIDKAPVQIV